jgi:hypothetical protein
MCLLVWCIFDRKHERRMAKLINKKLSTFDHVINGAESRDTKSALTNAEKFRIPISPSIEVEFHNKMQQIL